MENNKKIKVGICPTMSVFAEKLKKNNDNFEIIDLGSAGQVLYYLANDSLDLGLIGRLAKKSEFQGFQKELDDKEGFTLVSNQKDFILEDDLPELEIQTTLQPEIVKTNFPQLKNIIFKDKLNENLEEGEKRLISWKDWNDSFELLIPVDYFNNKVISFRKPYLFSKNKSLLDSINIK